MKRFLSILLLLLLLSACGQSRTAPSDEAPAIRVVTDSFGREVTIPAQVQTVVCTGSGALRMVSYLQCTDLLVGVEDTDKEYEISTLRDYAHVNHELFASLPSIGKGGGTGNTAYIEELIGLQPDVILSGYNEEALEELAQATGIPCVSIRARSINFIDESFYTAMRVASEVLGAEERCEAVLSYIDAAKADLAARTADIPESERRSCYAGAVTFSGAHGFTGTYSNFGPFLAIGAKNVADEVGEVGYFDADPEKIVAWDPDVIFLDFNGMPLINEDYQANPAFYNSLTAVRSGKVYSQISFRSSASNLETALADAYYAACVLYPEQFADIDPEAKAGEIFTELLGSNPYPDLKEAGYAFRAITLGE